MQKSTSVAELWPGPEFSVSETTDYLPFYLVICFVRDPCEIQDNIIDRDRFGGLFCFIRPH